MDKEPEPKQDPSSKLSNRLTPDSLDKDFLDMEEAALKKDSLEAKNLLILSSFMYFLLKKDAVNLEDPVSKIITLIYQESGKRKSEYGSPGNLETILSVLNSLINRQLVGTDKKIKDLENAISMEFERIPGTNLPPKSQGPSAQ